MDISLSFQAFSFLVMVACGILCGVIFDAFRSLRRHRKNMSSVVALQDLIFWILELSLVYVVIFKLNYALVRAYEGVALVLGSWIYFITLSKWVLGFFCTVVSWIIKIFKTIAEPFKRMGAFIGAGCANVWQHIPSFAKRTVSIPKSLIRRTKILKKIFTI